MDYSAITTTREQMTEALCDGDTLEGLDCFYNPTEGSQSIFATEPSELIHCRGNELPTREYDAGYGGTYGEPVVCFSQRYVYFRYAYDGSESIRSVPRHPEYVTAGILIE